MDKNMSDDELAGTAWTLVQFETDSSVIPALADAPATLSFTANDSDGSANRVAGSGGCNRYFGGYTLAGDRRSFGAMGSTRMMCAPDRMEQEDRFFKALQAAERYELADGELRVVYTEGVLHFKPDTESPTN